MRVVKEETRDDVVPVLDKKEIISFLLKDTLWSAEALACLDDAVYPLTKWYGTYKKQQLAQLNLVVEQLRPTPLLLLGNEQPVRTSFFKKVPLNEIHVECLLHDTSVITEYYDFTQSYSMTLMSLTRQSYQAHIIDNNAERLTLKDIPEIERLLKPYLGDTTFDAASLIKGIYYGIKQKGVLVSMAGTHSIVPAYRIGTVGNVVTKEEYRGKHLAYQCCAKLINDMWQFCDRVVVKVDQNDGQAGALYKKLGFGKHCDYFEGFGKRRNIDG